MELLQHMIYEIDRGVRPLALYTTSLDDQEQVEKQLLSRGVPYILDSGGEKNLNVFLGRKECIQILQRFSTLRLNLITPEEDFILGTMLGYDIVRQCRRYSCLHERQSNAKSLPKSNGDPGSSVASAFLSECKTSQMCGITCSLKRTGRHTITLPSNSVYAQQGTMLS